MCINYRMVNTLELGTIITLFAMLCIGIWYFSVAKLYSDNLSSRTVTRGANLIYNSKATGNTINLSCQGEIEVTSATQICSNPDSNNFENPLSDPISISSSNYGAFNPDTTVSLLSAMKKDCDGKSDCSYTFSPKPFPFGTCQGTTQLISTYNCVPV